MSLSEAAQEYSSLRIRSRLQDGDLVQIDRILSATAMFYPHEIQVALELLDEGLRLGDRSSYRFLIAEDCTSVVGYSCFGKIPCTASSFDLYWIAVRPDVKRRGIGRLLLSATEMAAKEQGGTRLFIDTASRTTYLPTQSFYASAGYELEARLRDFYSQGDDKLIFAKEI